MTTGVLQNVGSSIGGSLGGSAGAIIGGFLGSQAGSAIDNKLFGTDSNVSGRGGYRLKNLAVQSSAYGEAVPIIYGAMRVAGNIIWSQDIKETTITTESGGGKGGGSGKVKSSSTSYNYSITLAIAICEGEIDEILRVWADSKVLNPNDGSFRLYKGGENQLPDTLIEGIEGEGSVPAYRGLAYVIIEDFPLADYGNRIPNFTFEVKKKAINEDSEIVPVEDLITDMVMIPGSGEFVYDDTVQMKIPGQQVGDVWAQAGDATRINQNNREEKCDAILSLDKLESTCKNLEWVAVVATCFGDDLDAGVCVIEPGVEYKIGATTEPDIWASSSFNRSTARQITLENGSPIYGGTPSDASLLRYIKEIKTRGKKVVFYPLFFMDVENKPWRGRVTGSESDVANFFTKTNGYNEFINHYANLVKDDVDAFIIGSELIGLTKVRGVGGDYPAVDALISLASSVKSVVGSGVTVTYAADWSEYHHTDGGWFNLDPLWASSDIDVVGIDAYFPLTNEAEPIAGFSQEDLKNGWNSGEGYDFYYSDAERTIQEPLQAKYAWKNIQWWWENYHDNPDSLTSAWVPQSKKIWFTEFGFPSVDGASNQPNVFVDPDSEEGGYPRFSKKRVDLRAQRNAIRATLDFWDNSAMVERKFLWTWDARPFPYWPDLQSVWADGALWKTGHWVQRKIGTSELAAIVADLSKRGGLAENQIDVSRLTTLVDGFVLNDISSIRGALDALRTAYFFDAVESNGVIKYVARGVEQIENVAENDILAQANNSDFLSINRIQEIELPQKIDVSYINKTADYQVGNQHSSRISVNNFNVEKLSLPIAMSNQDAKIISDISLYNRWLSRTSYGFVLPIKYAYLEPSDVVLVSVEGEEYKMRITATHFGTPGVMRVEAVAEDAAVYDFYNEAGQNVENVNGVLNIGDTAFKILDLPAMPNDENGQGYLRYAGSRTEVGWKGAAVFRSTVESGDYDHVSEFDSACIMGKTLDALPDGKVNVLDKESSVIVSLYGSSEINSIDNVSLLNGSNIAIIGDEVVQFMNAELLSQGKYKLTKFLRGRQGTEHLTASHIAGEDFILLNENIKKISTANSFIGLQRFYKTVSFGNDIEDAAAVDFIYRANNLKPFSPVHIKGLRDLSGNVSISWIRRARLNAGLQDNVDVPLDEVSEIYEVDILNGEIVVRTLTASAPNLTYLEVDQVTDFGSAQASINVNIYQISGYVGRGTVGAATV